MFCLLVVVLVVSFASIFVTIALSIPSNLGRLDTELSELYVTTTAIAITLAMSIAIVVSPGSGLNLPAENTFHAKEAPSMSEVFVNMFPSNPINSLAQGNMLQIIVFAVLFGIAMAMTGDAGKRLTAIFEDINTVIMRLVTIIMHLAPYGVYVLMEKLS